MDLLAISIPSIVFSFSVFSVKYMTSLSPVFGTKNRKYPKENLNLHVFDQGDYCNFLNV